MNPDSIALSLSISFDGIAFGRLWQWTCPLTGATFTSPIGAPLELIATRLAEIRRAMPKL